MTQPISASAIMLCVVFITCIVTILVHHSKSTSDSDSELRRKLQVPQEAKTSTAIPQQAPTLQTAMVTDKFAAGQLAGAEPNKGYKEITGTHFPGLIAAATAHKRGRKMNDLTKDPPTNSLQTLLNTWTDGSYSPVHKHLEYAESFTALDGALAFFTFTEAGDATCHILHDGKSGGSARAIVIEKNEWHAMCAAPKALGYPGYAIVFETSGHVYSNTTATKVLAPFAPHDAEGNDGDNVFFTTILAKCPPKAV